MGFEGLRQTAKTHLSSERAKRWNPHARFTEALQNFKVSRARQVEAEEELLALFAAGAISAGEPNPHLDETARRFMEIEHQAGQAEGRLLGATTLLGIGSEQLHKEIIEEKVDSAFKLAD